MPSLITQPKQGHDQITNYRVEELRRLGFSAKESKKLGALHWHEFDVAKARRMLERGATHRQVLRILL